MSGARPSANERRLGSVRAIRDQYYGAMDPVTQRDAMSDLLAGKDERIEELASKVAELRAAIRDLRSQLAADHHRSIRTQHPASTPEAAPPETVDTQQPVFDFYRD